MKVISKKDFLICVYNTFYYDDIDYLSHIQGALSILLYYKKLDDEKGLLEYIEKQKGFIGL